MRADIQAYLVEIAIAEGRPAPTTGAEFVREASRELGALELAGCPAIAPKGQEREAFSASLYTETREQACALIVGGDL